MYLKTFLFCIFGTNWQDPERIIKGPKNDKYSMQIFLSEKLGCTYDSSADTEEPDFVKEVESGG